jgi:oligoendopeptidase F
MFETFPKTAHEALDWSWAQYEPYFRDLAVRDLTAATLDSWLADWSRLSMLVAEVFARLNVAVNVDTTDQAAEQRLMNYLENVDPEARRANHELNQKLLNSGLQTPGFEIALRNIRAEAELFREENLPLLTEEKKLETEYDKIIGAQTVEWEGKEITLAQLRPVYLDPDRARRERAWRLDMERRLADRKALNTLWGKFLSVRRQIAANADCSDYRAYKWRQQFRFDYSPQDCETFHYAIETVVVPAATRLYKKRRQRLAVDMLRPWDVMVDPMGQPPLKPFQMIDELVNKTADIFERVDPQLGGYFRTMRDEQLLDLENRKGKAPGGYCTGFPLARRPFIFMNSVGLHDDVQTMLHEAGHAFHAFESMRQPYYQQTDVPLEFCEVASMAMELLAAPYLTTDQGGFYTEEETARARVEHLEEIILFWPYMAVVDAFQHWVYMHPDAAVNPANCDAKWAELWERFMPGIDYGGLDDIKATGWQRKLHIYQVPFYYVEYGLAQLGAVQVWANSLQDQSGALNRYKEALALGSTRTIPQLFAAAGANFAFDAGTMNGAVTLLEETIEQLDPA